MPVRLHIAWLLLCCLCTSFADAQDEAHDIRLSASERSIFNGDSVIIDIEATGLIDEVDTRPLSRDADLLRETVGTRIAVVEGRVVEIQTRRMEFLPRGVGIATFGPLSGDTERGPVHSNTLRVKVLPEADTSWVPDTNDAAIKVSVTPEHPRVGQEFRLDIELRHRFPLTDETIVLPALDDFDVLPIYEQRRTLDRVAATDKATTDTPARKIAWRYLLWPRRSGAHSIGSLRWTGTLVRSRTSRAAIDLSSVPLDLQVQARASDSTAWWLPARQVSLTDRWSRDPRELTAGDDIERTLVLQAEGVLANHLPRVEPLASRSISSVLLAETRRHELIGERVRATAEYRFRLTARSPVPVFLDTVRVSWWDTERQQAAEAIVPARRVNIGLPDRADLLANIALEQSGSVRFNILLASVKLPTAIGVSLAVFLALAVLLALVLPWPSRIGRRHESQLPPM